MSPPPSLSREEIERRLEEAFGPPQCPEGCGDARRPKCMWELGSCPRQEVNDSWSDLKIAARNYLIVLGVNE